MVGVYTPEAGICEETKLFYEKLQNQVNSISHNGYIIL